MAHDAGDGAFCEVDVVNRVEGNVRADCDGHATGAVAGIVRVVAVGGVCQHSILGPLPCVVLLHLRGRGLCLL